VRCGRQWGCTRSPSRTASDVMCCGHRGRGNACPPPPLLIFRPPSACTSPCSRRGLCFAKWFCALLFFWDPGFPLLLLREGREEGEGGMHASLPTFLCQSPGSGVACDALIGSVPCCTFSPVSVCFPCLLLYGSKKSGMQKLEMQSPFAASACASRWQRRRLCWCSVPSVALADAGVQAL